MTIFSADAVYDNEIGRHTRYCLSMWIRLNESVLRGGRKELLKLLRNYSVSKDLLFIFTDRYLLNSDFEVFQI